MTALLTCLLLLAAGMAVTACGDDDSTTDGGADTDADTDSDTDADYEITATVTVPDDFAAEPVNLVPVFYGEYPPGAGMPLGMGDEFADPAIGVGTPFELSTKAYQFMSTEQIADGTYYMAVVLFVQGGGTSMPIEGVDWAGSSDVAITIPATGAVDCGDIELAPYGGQGDAGVDGGE